MRYWEPKKDWAGKTAVVLASGPSMTYEVADRVFASGVKAIAVSNQGIPTNGRRAMAPWADIMYAGDYSWWYHNFEAVTKFVGIKAAIDTENHRWTPELLSQMVFFRHGGVEGFDDRVGYIRTGGNSGYQAVHIAIALGAKRVVLCGFDMHKKNGEHWFGHHKWKRGYSSRYDLFINRFNSSAKTLLKRAEVVNATPGSALQCFPMMTLEEALYGVPSMRGTSSQGERDNSQSIGGTETISRRDTSEPTTATRA